MKPIIKNSISKKKRNARCRLLIMKCSFFHILHAKNKREREREKSDTVPR